MKGRLKIMDKLYGSKTKEGYDDNEDSINTDDSYQQQLKQPNLLKETTTPNNINQHSSHDCKPIYNPECPVGLPGPAGKPGYDGG